MRARLNGVADPLRSDESRALRRTSFSVRIKARGTVIAGFVVKQAATVCVYIPVQSRRDGS
jgi:hypothetical protein